MVLADRAPRSNDPFAGSFRWAGGNPTGRVRRWGPMTLTVVAQLIVKITSSQAWGSGNLLGGRVYPYDLYSMTVPAQVASANPAALARCSSDLHT